MGAVADKLLSAVAVLGSTWLFFAKRVLCALALSFATVSARAPLRGATSNGIAALGAGTAIGRWS